MTDNEVLREFFDRVYSVLVEHTGAPDNEDARFAFVFEFTGQRPTSQYRFGGILGFGGKFFFPAFNVSCYSEDRTAEREAAIQATNVALKAMATEYRALVSTA